MGERGRDGDEMKGGGLKSGPSESYAMPRLCCLQAQWRAKVMMKGKRKRRKRRRRKEEGKE